MIANTLSAGFAAWPRLPARNGAVARFPWGVALLCTGLCALAGGSLLIAALALGGLFWLREADRAQLGAQLATAQTSWNETHTTLASGGAALLYWDVVGGRLQWSASFYDILGLRRSDGPLTMREMRDIVHEDDDLYAALGVHLRAGSAGFQTTLRLRHADGSDRFAAIRGRIVRPFGASVPHVIAVLTDITDDHELAARETQVLGRLRDAVEHTAESFVLWDRDDKLVACNGRFRAVYQLPLRVLQPGTPYALIAAAACKPLMQGPFTPAGVRKTGGSYEASLGPGCWLQIGERFTADGGFVSVGTDITALKRSERRASEKEQVLEATVADLVASRAVLQRQQRELVDLAQQLAVEKARAEDANRAKSQFLAGMSHELRTPLNAIIGFSEMMRDEIFGRIGSDKYREYASDICASGVHLRDVINDILDMSKIEANRLTLDPERFPLAELADETLRVVASAAAERNIALGVHGHLNLEVLADRRALKQVFINLLSNAIKFTPAGGEVSLRAYRYRGSIRIAIADTGVGISRHDIARLGRPFEQAENQFSKGHKGTGLGLAISRSLLEMHGGKLDIKSRVGEGTVVTCVLPLTQETELGLAA